VAKQKAKTVNLGSKGSFKIKRPGAFTAKAKAAGMSVQEAAHAWKHEPGLRGDQARAALGFAAMKH
jgi:hypothetical protein